jgi:hypothetical protein
MVVFKALNLYMSWCERGPKGTVYSVSKSGWFDGFQYEKWFFEILLPNAKRNAGVYILVLKQYGTVPYRYLFPPPLQK